MEMNSELVLEVFLRNELSATQARIDTTSIFVSTLKKELACYQNDLIDNARRKSIELVLSLYQNIIQTYTDELKLLENKKKQMNDHLKSVQTIAVIINRSAENDIWCN